VGSVVVCWDRETRIKLEIEQETENEIRVNEKHKVYTISEIQNKSRKFFILLSYNTIPKNILLLLDCDVRIVKSG
jgi:hypothetical protein